MPHEDLSAIHARAQQRVGRTVREKWRIDSLLGVGGMAAVYAATHRNGKRAALKFLHPELLISETLRTRFLREGHVANRVGHSGAVSVIDDDIAEDGGAFLVMELLEGENLEQRWRAQGTLACGDVLMIADQILDVLQAAHQKDIIHRDLKPANIFVCHDGSVKILDFGIARLREMSATTTAPGAAVTTMSSMGTPSFMPPEQARGRWEQVDARSDLWALGATMFSLLAGRFVHVEQTTNEQLLAGMTKPAPKLHEIAPEIPKEACDVVDRALAFSPDDRWPDARSMQEAVREAYRRISGKAMTQRRRVFFPPLDADASGEAPTLSAQSAPTLAASSVSSPGAPPPRSVTTDASAPAKPRSRKSIAIAGGAVLIVGVIVFVAVRGGKDTSPPTGSPPANVQATTSATATEAATAAAPETEAATPTPSTMPTPIPTSTAAIIEGAPNEPPKGTIKTLPKNKPISTIAPAPTPSASAAPVASAVPSSTTVDIFGRRR